MPIYEYECGVCQCCFERKQRFDDEPVAICPECEGKARRVINSVPIIFKGSGFYITDSRQGGGGWSEKSEGKTSKAEKGKE
ncbi:FmdB family zinc ribbon protein [Chloroflexota bacterium]